MNQWFSSSSLFIFIPSYLDTLIVSYRSYLMTEEKKMKDALVSNRILGLELNSIPSLSHSPRKRWYPLFFKQWYFLYLGCFVISCFDSFVIVSLLLSTLPHCFYPFLSDCSLASLKKYHLPSSSWFSSIYLPVCQFYRIGVATTTNTGEIVSLHVQGENL